MREWREIGEMLKTAGMWSGLLFFCFLCYGTVGNGEIPENIVKPYGLKISGHHCSKTIAISGEKETENPNLTNVSYLYIYNTHSFVRSFYILRPQTALH